MARHSKGKYWVVGFVLVIAIIAIAFVSSMNSQSKKPKASEYFKIEHTKSIAEKQGNTVIVKELGLKITPTMGDASNIIIQVDSAEKPYLIDFLGKGDLYDMSIQLRGYTTSLSEYGYPLTLEIGCSEAEPDEITIYLNPDDIIASS